MKREMEIQREKGGVRVSGIRTRKGDRERKRAATSCGERERREK